MEEISWKIMAGSELCMSSIETRDTNQNHIAMRKHFADRFLAYTHRGKYILE